MALPPNQAGGSGNLNARKRYVRHKRRQERKAERQETRARDRAKPTTPQAPSAPTQPTYGPYRQRAEREANLRYGPLNRELDQQQVNITGTPQQPGWFDAYKAAAAQAGQDVAGRYQAAQTEIANRQMVAPASGQSPELQQAMGAQGAVNTSFQNLLTTASTADQNYFSGRGTVADASKLSAQLDTQKAKTDLASDRGEFVLVRKSELKDQAHTKRLENKVFGLDVAKAQADAANEAADRKADAKGERREVIASGPFAGYTKGQIRRMSPEEKNKLRQGAKKPSTVITSGAFAGLTHAQVRKMPTGQKAKLVEQYNANKGGSSSGKDPFGNTPKQRQAAQDDWDSARTVGKSLFQKGDTWQDLYELIVLENGDLPPTMARAAAQWIVNKKIGGKARANLRKRGVRLPKNKTVTAPINKSPGSDAAQGNATTAIYRG